MSTDNPTVQPATTVFPRKADGSVNWRAMVPPAYLYVKKEHEEKAAKLLNKPISELANLTTDDLTKIPDRFLVIRKAGILELARLRGYDSSLADVKHVQRDYVVIQNRITWLPFEGQDYKTTSGVGEACPENTSKMGCLYLAAMAENRAFARCVRQFLEIDIVSSDELGAGGVEPEQNPSSLNTPQSQASNELSPSGTLSRAAVECGFSFEQVKKAAIVRWEEDSAKVGTDPNYRRRIEGEPGTWNDFKDIPPRDCLTLIALIKAYKAAKDTKNVVKQAEPAPTASKQPEEPQSSIKIPAIEGVPQEQAAVSAETPAPKRRGRPPKTVSSEAQSPATQGQE